MARAIHNHQRWEELAETAGYQANMLAKLCNRSSRQLRRQFQSTVGCSPQRWLDKLRLRAAQEILISGLSVKEVAWTLGFKQSSHFCRQFKTATGMTPSQFAVLNPTSNERPLRITNVPHR